MNDSVTLLIPPNPFLEDEKRNCPLGILYVAASLERAGYDVQVIDLRGRSKDEWQNIPLSEAYGITSSSADFPYAKEVADFLRARGPSKIIIGGAHSVALDECLRNGFSVVVGEGEIAILDMLKNDSQVARSPFIEHMDSIPFPARHLLPKESVVSTTLCHQGVPATTIISRRGCPYNCTFCSSPKLWGRKVRKCSVENTLIEIERLVKDYGIKELRFQDDVMNLDKKWLKAIAPPMAELGIRWRCNARAEAGNWEYMREASCYEVSIGIETANDKAHRIHKRTPLERTKAGIWEAYRAGLQVRVCFIIGLPYDDGDISSEVIRFIEELPPLSGVFLSLLSPNLGSAIGDAPDTFGVEIIKKPISSVPEPGGAPEFSFELKGIDMEKLKYHYQRLDSYVREKGLKH